MVFPREMETWVPHIFEVPGGKVTHMPDRVQECLYVPSQVGVDVVNVKIQ